MRKIIKQCYNAYGKNPETYIVPDPEKPQEHSNMFRTTRMMITGRIYPPKDTPQSPSPQDILLTPFPQDTPLPPSPQDILLTPLPQDTGTAKAKTPPQVATNTSNCNCCILLQIVLFFVSILHSVFVKHDKGGLTTLLTTHASLND